MINYRLNSNPEDNDEKIDVTSNASSSGSIIVAPTTVEKEISTTTMSKPTLSLSDASAANAAQAVAASGILLMIMSIQRQNELWNFQRYI